MEKETDTDKILRAIASVHEDIADIRETMATKDDVAALRTELKADIATVRSDLDNGFTEVNRRLEKVVQPQLDDNVHRIKKIEEEVFPH